MQVSGTLGQSTRKRVGIAVASLLALLLSAPLAHAVSFTVNPSAVGAPQSPFTASIVDFSYSSTVNQTAPAGTCTNANPCTFTETGTGSFSNFKTNFTTPVINSGLNQSPGYTMTGNFNATGTATPFNSGIKVNYDTFDLRLFANGNLVAQSTGLVAGEANVFGPDLAKGDFHVVLNIEPVGGFLSGPFVTGLNVADFAGNNTNLQGFSLGSFTNGRIQGSGNLSFNVIPEPTTLLLIGSGLAMLGWARRKQRRL
ncbi:flocculation-associated PEP-CTERM protein PepA [Candidatus Nitrospira bockiana]